MVKFFYNGTQLVIGLISLGSGLKDLPKASVNIYKNFLGGVKVTQGAKTFFRILLGKEVH